MSNNWKPEEAFQEISCGDGRAYEFCRACFEWFHVLDDLIDRDKDVPPNILMGTLLKFMEVLTRNEFYQQHREDLFACLTTAGLASAASMRMAKAEGLQERLASEVLKSQYQEVFFRVAFWTGGSSHAFAMDTKYRGYCFG